VQKSSAKWGLILTIYPTCSNRRVSHLAAWNVIFPGEKQQARQICHRKEFFSANSGGSFYPGRKLVTPPLPRSSRVRPISPKRTAQRRSRAQGLRPRCSLPPLRRARILPFTRTKTDTPRSRQPQRSIYLAVTRQDIGLIVRCPEVVWLLCNFALRFAERHRARHQTVKVGIVSVLDGSIFPPNLSIAAA
jgi:hypothetical protein